MSYNYNENIIENIDYDQNMFGLREPSFDSNTLILQKNNFNLIPNEPTKRDKSRKRD